MTSLPEPRPLKRRKLTRRATTPIRDLNKVKKAYRTGGSGNGELVSPARNVRNQEIVRRWVKEAYMSEWTVVRALQQEIGRSSGVQRRHAVHQWLKAHLIQPGLYMLRY